MAIGAGRSLIEVITKAIEDARQRGHDERGQIEHAVETVLSAEPALSREAARRLVETLMA